MVLPWELHHSWGEQLEPGSAPFEKLLGTFRALRDRHHGLPPAISPPCDPQFILFKREKIDESPTTGCTKTIYSFFDFIDEKEEAVKKIFKKQPEAS
ncbi:hypothetical protein KSP40_PGU020550 [Platanthera guangdongensis]|uniref:Uncharacterized protein n=1 Tax=Platanthera guangdongensis TaxID=2320717 RepID=A0ABR2LKG1_9ASPA